MKIRHWESSETPALFSLTQNASVQLVEDKARPHGLHVHEMGELLLPSNGTDQTVLQVNSGPAHGPFPNTC